MSFFKKLFNNNQPMDWKAFVTYYADHASQQLGQPVEIEWGDDIEQTTIHLPNGQGDSMAGYLGNFYALYRHNPEDLDNIVARTFAGLMEAFNGNPEGNITAHIFPVIKNHEWMAQYREQMRQTYPNADTQDGLLYAPIAGDLVLNYVLDLNESMRYLTEKDLEEQQIAIEDLFPLASQNFLDYSDEHVSLEQIDNSSVVLFWLREGTYNASLLLYVNNLLDAAGLPFAHDCICAVPARDALLACPVDDEAAIALMREVAAEFAAESPYRVSDYFYRVKDGEITLFDQMPPQH